MALLLGDLFRGRGCTGCVCLPDGGHLHHLNFGGLDDPRLVAATLRERQGRFEWTLYDRAHLARAETLALPRGTQPIEAAPGGGLDRHQRAWFARAQRAAARLPAAPRLLREDDPLKELEEAKKRLQKSADELGEKQEEGKKQASEDDRKEEQQQRETQQQVVDKVLPDVTKVLDSEVQSLPEHAITQAPAFNSRIGEFFATPINGTPPEGFRPTVETVEWTLPDGREVPLLVNTWQAFGNKISLVVMALALQDPALPSDRPRESRIYWTRFKHERMLREVQSHVAKSSAFGFGLGLGLGLSGSVSGSVPGGGGGGGAQVGGVSSAPALQNGTVSGHAGIMLKLNATVQRARARTRADAFGHEVLTSLEMGSAPLFGGGLDPNDLPDEDEFNGEAS